VWEYRGKKDTSCISTLFRGFITRNLCIMRRAFITYIRPIVEYNCAVWNPSLIHLINLIENVQRHFSQRIPELSPLSYPDRLALLNLEPVELIRLRFDLIYYLKILNHQTPFGPSDAFIIYTPVASSRRVRPDCKNLPKHQINIFTHYFIGTLMFGIRCQLLSDHYIIAAVV
jgi:hypothetical protein